MAASDGRQRARTRSLLVVAGVGAVAVVGATVLSGVAMIFVGGDDFREVEHVLWLFAVLGTVLAMLQLEVYAALARQGRRAVALAWAALVAAVLLGSQAATVTGLVVTVTAVDATLLVVLGVLGSRAARQAHVTTQAP